MTRAGFATKREAQDALREELARQAGGLAAIAGLTVGQYLDSWLEAKRNLRETTRRNYSSHLRLYLKPGLGSYRLVELRPHHIDRLYDGILAGRHPGATETTVQHLHRTLRSALNAAVRRRLIPWNPAAHVELPEKHRTTTSVWLPEEVARFLEAAAEHRLQPLFHVMAFTGLRRGEAIGLHWADVDLERGLVSVRWQVTDAGNGPKLGPPKTASGHRLVPIDPMTVNALRTHRERVLKQREEWGAAWIDTDLVFTREGGGILRPDSITHLFRQLVLTAGVPRIRLHDLRHTHATMALSAGVDIKVISNRLGHSTTSITSDLYTHVVPTLAREAADSIAALMPPRRAAGIAAVSEM